MTDAGEVAADVGLEYVVHLLGHDLQAQRLQSVVRVAPRSKAVTAVEEIRFKHGLDNARYRSLQQPIRDRGDPQWARSGFAWLSLSETQSCWQLISNRAMLPPYARGLQPNLVGVGRSVPVAGLA